MLRLAVTRGKAANVRELVRPMAEQGDAWEKMQDLNDEPSYLFLAVEEGHVEVVKALLEVGGRELVIMTRDDGVSCVWISAQNGHLEVLKALLEVGGRELVILTMDNGVSQLPLHQCAVGASGCAESAAGGRGARSAAADQGRWSLLSFCRTSCKPRGGLQGTGDGVPDRRPVFARDHDPQAWLNLQQIATQVRHKKGLLLFPLRKINKSALFWLGTY